MKIKLQAIAAIACGLAVTQVGHTAGNPGAYWTDPDGEVYKNAEGECWKSPDWTEADATMECDPELVPKPKPKPKPKPVAKPAPAPEPKPIVRDIRLGADTHFVYDGTQLTAEGIRTIEELAGRLKNTQDLSIDIAGHTDSIGPETYNQGLSERRAATVKKEFVESGISPDVITTRGYGESVPVASNATRKGRAKNRRVDITILGTKTIMP
jgi:OOP family OmpA-OmpF porin